MNRTLLCFLAAIFLAAWAPQYSSAQTIWTGGAGTQASPYEISTADGLYNLALAVNGGNAYSGIYFILTADLDLSSYAEWPRIGYYSTSTNRPFSGIFDGGGKTIDYLTITTPVNYAALFGNLEGSSALITNITLTNVRITGAYGAAGVLATADYGATISNCIVE
ncbi:MAG: hypothetical protein LBD28_07055, partial [Tannerellaceae bacterium]|nr:hypothetical protein [Tannerellaceae bacterium]